MNAKDLMAVPEWECMNEVFRDGPLTSGYTSDLLSDVMAHAPAGSALITLQAHLNTVAVAALADVRAIIVCHGRPIPDDMLAAVAREGILLMRTRENQFEASVKLHQRLMEP